MDAGDVRHRLLQQAPLVVYDEDIENDKTNFIKLQKFFAMTRSSQSSNMFTRRFSRRSKSTATVIPNPTFTDIEKNPNARIVRIRLVFLHIGDIDTLNEKYQADIYYEARWTEKKLSLSSLNLTSQQQREFHQNKLVKLTEFNSSVYWSPQLYIENAIAQLGEQDKWFSIKKFDTKFESPSSPLFVNVEICEHRRMKGVFWEKLELNHFPADVQDLTISITSHHHIDNCILVQDEQLRSIINREAFVDQQEWELYEHVATEIRETNEEYSFEDISCGIEQKKHPVLGITCRAARRPGYYYWNGFCLIFLITICSFCIFTIPPNLPQSRLQITCTLVLTSITFRWVVNRSLPQISYLTTLDIYAIISIIILVVLCIWHSIIATIIFFYGNILEELTSNSIFIVIDRFVFVCLFTIYIVIHIALFIWLICVPYKRRREMEYLDREYVSKKHIQLNSGYQQELNYHRSSSILGNIPVIKSVPTMRQSDGVVLIPNTTTFIPIQEANNETRRKTIDVEDVREHDEQYFQQFKINRLSHTEQV